MALSIPSYPDPRDPATPVAPAYGWISGLALDLRAGTGRVVLSVHPHPDAWQGQPVDQLGVALGQVVRPADPEASPPVAEVRFPSLTALMADPEFAAAYAVIGAKLYAAMATVPSLAGSTPAP